MSESEKKEKKSHKKEKKSHKKEKKSEKKEKKRSREEKGERRVSGRDWPLLTGRGCRDDSGGAEEGQGREQAEEA